MKRALAALGTFAVIGFGVLLGTTPAVASIDSCIQSTACAPVSVTSGDMTHDGADPGMTHNGTDPGMTHDGADAICRC